MQANIYERDLGRNAANFQPLTPLTFLDWSASVYPDKTAVVHGETRYSYRKFYERCRRLASALSSRGVGLGDTVAVMAPNVPALLEAHYGVPMVGAVLNALNIRLDAATVAFILEHAEANVLITDREFSPVIKSALTRVKRKLLVIDIDDPLAEDGELLGEQNYEVFLQGGDRDFEWQPPADEWQALALNYTSGTTGNPKGVVYHHRGAFLNAVADLMAFGLNKASVYLWTLPMFHCNGWSFTWAVTAAAGTHICLRRADPAVIFQMIHEYRVTHMCGAPTVLSSLIHAPQESKIKFHRTIHVATGGSAPPSPVIAAMEDMGFRVVHLYGMTETYGPSSICVWQEMWDQIGQEEKAARIARQGVRYPMVANLKVADPQTMEAVPPDGSTVGEIMVKGNTTMKGYLKNPGATREAFDGGWLRSGDLAVMHPDGYMEIKDRSKDIIISGGENISSLEVEEVLYRHPKVLEAAVVAKPDEKWGETPCAFVALKPDIQQATPDEIIQWCRSNMAHFKAPKTVVFGPLPKTSTGKVQKFALRERARRLGSRCTRIGNASGGGHSAGANLEP